MSSNFRSATPPPPGENFPQSPHPSPSPRSKTLMETLLVAKMEQITLGHPGRPLVRTDSGDSASSFGSVNSFTRSDVCRCDDCLLGIGDLWQQDGVEEKKKKVSLIAFLTANQKLLVICNIQKCLIYWILKY